MKLIKTLIATALVFASAAATAIPVTLNVVDGKWTDVTGGDHVEYRDGGKEVRWGGNVYYKKKSGYRFDENPYLPVTFDTSDAFILGKFTHFNEPIPTGSAISAATLNISTELDIFGTSVTDGPYDFQFSHNETLNNACGWNFLCWFGLMPGTGAVDDIVMLNTAIQSNEFTVDSYAFSMEILGFYDFKKGALVDEIETREDATSSAKIIARLNVREIPQQVSEPASLALLGISLLGLVVLRRRRDA